MRLIHSEDYEGFNIDVYAMAEYTSLGESDIGDWEDVNKKLERGELEWFCAKVTASRDGIELADEYLGCCLYKNASDFVRNTDYYYDMRDAAVKNAIETIKTLARSIDAGN